MLRWVGFVFSCTVAFAQAPRPCEGVAAYSPCEMTFEVAPNEAAAHPDPYIDVQLHAEVRSPRFRTYLMPAFWDGGRKLVIRFTPQDAGQFTYRLTSNLASLEGKQGSFTATESSAPGYVHPANVHHWWTENKQPHLWMGFLADRLGFESNEYVAALLRSIDGEKFNHIRVNVLGRPADRARVVVNGKPNPAYFDELDSRILQLHGKLVTTDIVLASDPAYLTSLFPDWQSRERFVRYLVARYASLNITWQGVLEWEDVPNARDLLKEIGLAIKKLDPYDHPRSTNSKITSTPLLTDGWMNFVITNSEDDQLGAVQHQFYTVPFIGITSAAQLWDSTMDGQYPVLKADPRGAARRWFDFMSDQRHWELEPYFDVDNCRAVALEGAEYLAYIEHPATVEISIEKHSYNVTWVNPANGEAVEAKKYKGESFATEPPDKTHPWLLLLAREGHLASMLKSYKFESRVVPVQEIEANPQKVPYAVAEPSVDTLHAGAPVKYAVKLKRESRATREMMYLWTAEAASGGQGARVLGTGASGTFTIPPVIATQYPATLSIRVTALNANGKAYLSDKVYQLAR